MGLALASYVTIGPALATFTGVTAVSLSMARSAATETASTPFREGGLRRKAELGGAVG